MLIKYILEKNKKGLNFLGKSEDIDLIIRSINEFKKHLIDVNILEENINDIKDEYLKLKLKDITTIYSKYEEIPFDFYSIQHFS